MGSESERPGHAARVEEARSLPPSWYVEPQRYAQEVARIFRREWLAVARLDEVATPGDYACIDLFDEPLVVVRETRDTVRVMSRICRHRAMPILEGRGHARSFSCPYHHWTYALDGTLLGSPAMESAVGFDRGAERLPELRVEIWQGWIFANFDPDAAPLGPRLAPLAALLEPHALSEMRVATTLRYDSPWNWKVMVENFMESYHHVGPHAATLQPTHPAFGSRVENLGGPFAVLENPGRTGDVPPFWACGVFPAHLFALTRGPRPFCTWYQMHVRSEVEFLLEIKILVPPAVASRPDAVQAIATMIDRVHREDIVVCEGVQRGLRARLAAPGRMSHLERANWLFHEYLIERLPGGATS